LNHQLEHLQAEAEELVIKAKKTPSSTLHHFGALSGVAKTRWLFQLNFTGNRIDSRKISILDQDEQMFPQETLKIK
jgi:hypothetical protein